MVKTLSDRYLSSKVTHNKGDFREIPWENWEVVINFLDGESPNYVSKSFKKECATEKEAKKLESKALSIIQLAITDPKFLSPITNEFFKTTII